jgi:hypothetical protein
MLSYHKLGFWEELIAASSKPATIFWIILLAIFPITFIGDAIIGNLQLSALLGVAVGVYIYLKNS